MTVPLALCQITGLFCMQNILNDLLYNDSRNYDSKIPPNYNDVHPTVITVQLFVLSLDSVNEQSMEFSMSVFLRQNWSDTRLQWESKYNLSRLEVDTKMMNDVWSPDLYFVNEKRAIKHDVTVPNKLLHIYKPGMIQTSQRISMTMSCDMYLERYPHDEQICYVNLGSYSYSSENVVFQWHRTPVLMRKGLTLPRFQVRFHGASDTCQYDFGTGNLIDGNFTCISASFQMSRQFGYYVAQVYIPSILIVCLSWVSFWIDIDAIPARVSLGLLTVLTMTTQSTGERAMLPKVSYVKAIDVWMAACLLFVFAALLEFAYVNVQSRVEKRRRDSVMKPGVASSSSAAAAAAGSKSLEAGDSVHFGHKEITLSSNRKFVFLRDALKREKARRADKIARAAFPAAFLIFNLVYWLYYQL